MAGRYAQGNRSFTRATQSQGWIRFSLRNCDVICRFGRQGTCVRVAEQRIGGTRRRTERQRDRFHARFPALRSALRRTGAQNRFPAIVTTTAESIPRLATPAILPETASRSAVAGLAPAFLPVRRRRGIDASWRRRTAQNRRASVRETRPRRRRLGAGGKY